MRRTKVCHLSTVHNKNDIRIFYKECNALAAAGYDVTFLTQGTHDEIIDGVRQLGAGKPVIRKKLKRILKGGKILIKAALEEDADIYHIHDSELLRYVNVLKKAGKMVVYDSHEHLPMQIMEKEWLPSFLRRLVSMAVGIYEIIKVKKVDLIIVVADKTYDRFTGMGIQLIKVENLPIYNEFKDISINFRHKTEKRKICYSGAVWMERGLDTMCIAASKIEDMTFEIAGRIDHGDPEGFIRGIGDNIVYSGYHTRDRVMNLYEDSIAGVCLFKPYPNNMIDPPTKIYEYMAAGIPVIASDFKSITGVVEKYNCGICIDPLDITAIRNAMRYILDNPGEAEKMGRNGRIAVMEELNWELHSKILLSAYAEMMERNNG